MPQATPRRIWRRLLIVLAIILLLPVASATVLVLTLDTEALKPRITAAVESATGRRLTLSGPISFTTSIVPTIAIDDIALANAPGGSAPEMLTARRIELRLALLPLLSREIDIRSLTLVEPHLLLETDAEGRPNWLFAANRPPGPPPADSVPAPPREPSAGMAFGLRALTLTGGSVIYRDGATGTAHTLLIERLATRASGQRLAHEARVTVNGTAIRLQGESGTIAGFMAPVAPWPLRLALDAEGATLAIEGEASEPARLRGWRGTAEGTLDRTDRLAALLPRLSALPPGADVTFRLTAHEVAGAPVIDGLRLGIGGVDLGALRPGLALRRLAMLAEASDAPISLTAEAMLGTTPLTLRGTAGTLVVLQQASPDASMPVDLTLAAANAEVRAQGMSGVVFTGAGLDLAMTARIPDAAAFGALAGVRVPPLRDLTAAGRVTIPAPGQVAIADLRATSSAGDVAGAVTLALGARFGISGTLASERLDLTGATGSAPTTAPATPATVPVAPAQPAAAAPPAPGPRRVIPDVALNVDSLRGADADLQLTISTLILGAELPLRAVTTHLVLREGRLLLDPITATSPGGPIAGSIGVDASVAPPAMRLALHAEGLDLAALRAAVGDRLGNGRLDVDLALSGAGSNTRALAASLDGFIGLALVDGRIAPSMLAGIPPDLIRVLVPQGVPPEGLPLRCLALRAPAARGILRAETFLAETSLGRIGATGTVNLGDERIDLRMLPDLRTAIINLRAPVPISGTLTAPRLGRIDAAAAAAAGLGALLGAQRTPDRTLEGAAEALGGGNPALPDCGAALLAARGGRQGTAPTAPAPTPAPPVGSSDAPRAPNAVDILRGLLGGARR
ncbi:AsmA family protein [Plastoroseomonas arctica]|uniref:AsmA family protein n=1 Tax=Plastoroseomonas arctica TaxID=1509237 RepID=A0AAF1JZD9_9PROT|nr:AsmA family protein [Plastoroseomonas arctica]MBR0655718.1 AsmA family protein [Plastoroseomonas arctica]